MAGQARHTDDQTRLRHGRDRHEGFAVGRYLQPAPMLFSRDGHNLFLGDIYRGRSAFLLCSGPSLTAHDLTLLNQPGVLTCAVNNAATVHRPQLWISADDPGNFCDVIWRDPGIFKFVPLCHMEKHFFVRDAEDSLVPADEVVGDMPAVFGFRRNETFNAETWLYEDSFNWGNHGKRVDAYGNKGSRSIMYIALRLLFYLGVRRLYLLGCDFRMQHGRRNYAFEQDRSPGSVRGNNDSYRVLNVRLKHLLPYFEREGFEVFNCTPDSGLQVFPFVSFEQAIESVQESVPKKIITTGMYDRAPIKKSPPAVHANGHMQQNGNGVVETDEDKIPEMTLVVDLDEENVQVWQRTWQTWRRFKPWLTKLPLLVIHERRVDMATDALDFLHGHDNLRQVAVDPVDNRGIRDPLPAALVRVPAEHVNTPWYVRIDPRAVATSSQPWLFGDWFANDQQGRPPVFVSCPWGYTRPADAIAKLDDWADAVTGLSNFPRVELPYNPLEKRILHPTINSWCIFANTEWTRSIAQFTPDTLPHPNHSTYVHYCALRRKDRFVSVQLKDFGWEHHFRPARWFIDRCEQVLS